VAAELWTVLCTQIGVAQVALPEHPGGAGYGASALGVVAHELGRVLAPVPFVASAVLATGLLLDAHAGDRATHLSGLLSGQRTAAAAITGDGGLWSRAAVTLNATRSGDDWRIDGVVRHVLNGTAADDLLVVASIDSEPAVFLLDRTAEGVTAVAERVLDGTRPMATVTCTGAPASLLTGEGPADDLIERNVNLALAILSAEQVGACERVLEIATDYARTREQFGRPIGSFQAIKHHCANMAISANCARDQVGFAAVAVDDGRSDAALQVECALWVAGCAALDNAGKNIQIHGGIGFSDEADPHLCLKRAQLLIAIAGGLEAANQRIAAGAGSWR
jgi:alkylation response protein AidB-like acyl-CoA dehydrogenase